MTKDRIPTPKVPSEYKVYTGEDRGPSYRQIYIWIVDGLIPAHQVNGRWFIYRDDLPVIAARWNQKIAA